MPTNLTLLRVSLTKHGAHKLAILFEDFDSTQVLDHVWGSVDGVNIELAQAKKNLSARGQVVPGLWDKARARGSETVSALVLIGIIFSHYQLINAMIRSTDETVAFSGTIVRDQHLGGKAFTNFAHTLEELGYTTAHSENHVRYDLTKLFHIPGLHELAIELLVLKLKAAAWDSVGSPVDEMLAFEFHHVFSITAEQFANWLTTGDIRATAEVDLSFFENASDTPVSHEFVFKSGHNPKKTGKVGVKPSKLGTTADLLHNKMQNMLFESLSGKFGKECVGTEVPTGAGTTIDLVVRTMKFCWFYEIKTARTIKACIRQALPQLLEYAYWQGKTDTADKLIIVGPAKMTAEGELYLKLLRENFSIPIEYEFLSRK
ncbi:hypothetical protein [Janthinobacterium sp. BJB304]|uniref:hypothetical protein n=1 Tax=Janthinobacterium sp. BJB304 TaxID=1572871 RepID=UPI000C0F5074|nr:hypothetical protein [Janthinobacterium sp. BJB304]PHV39202.1 hypothetical protein CSQ95_10835 [Janthinobacterium sp. BJB304]